MLKLLTLAGAVYLLFALLTRGKRNNGENGKLREQADRAVLALATTTRYVMIGILLFVCVGLGMLVYDFWKG